MNGIIYLSKKAIFFNNSLFQHNLLYFDTYITIYQISVVNKNQLRRNQIKITLFNLLSDELKEHNFILPDKVKKRKPFLTE